MRGHSTGRGAVWLAHWSGGPGVAGSNPAVPTSGDRSERSLQGRAWAGDMNVEATEPPPGAPDRRLLTVPNVLSLLRLTTVPVFVVLFVTDRTEAAVILYAVGAWTDFLDGYIARRTGSVTEFGKLLDPLADRIFIVALAVALVAAGALPLWITIVVVAHDILILSLFPILERRGGEGIPVNLTG